MSIQMIHLQIYWLLIQHWQAVEAVEAVVPSWEGYHHQPLAASIQKVVGQSTYVCGTKPIGKLYQCNCL
eukprot:3936927-Rhodomonas_salina.1